MAEAIIQNQSITFLDVSSNNFTPEAEKIIASLLYANQTLKQLLISSSSLRVRGELLGPAILFNGSLVELGGLSWFSDMYFGASIMKDPRRSIRAKEAKATTLWLFWIMRRCLPLDMTKLFVWTDKFWVFEDGTLTSASQMYRTKVDQYQSRIDDPRRSRFARPRSRFV